MDICLSASNYHPETWSPQWTLIGIVQALRLHMLLEANEIGGVVTSNRRRKQLAVQSQSWKCSKIDHSKMMPLFFEEKFIPKKSCQDLQQVRRSIITSSPKPLPKHFIKIVKLVFCILLILIVT